MCGQNLPDSVFESEVEQGAGCLHESVPEDIWAQILLSESENDVICPKCGHRFGANND